MSGSTLTNPINLEVNKHINKGSYYISNHRARTWDYKGNKPLGSKLLLLSHFLDSFYLFFCLLEVCLMFLIKKKPLSCRPKIKGTKWSLCSWREGRADSSRHLQGPVSVASRWKWRSTQVEGNWAVPPRYCRLSSTTPGPRLLSSREHLGTMGFLFRLLTCSMLSFYELISLIKVFSVDDEPFISNTNFKSICKAFDIFWTV